MNEALRAEFPALLAVVGGDEFAALVRTYIAAHPSQHFSLHWVGRALAEYLRHTAPYASYPLLTQLAGFEWTLSAAFDAADAIVLGSDALAQLSPADWPDLRVVGHPSVRQIELGAQVPACRRAAKAGEAVDVTSPVGAASIWRVWRQGLKIMFRSLDELESKSLQILTQASFIDVCSYLSERLPEAEVPTFTARLLATAIAEGAVTRREQADALRPADARQSA